MKTNRFLVFLLLCVFTQCRKASVPEQTRSFHMAVTPWPSDFTPAAIDSAYAFINNHCDMVSHHFDEGIPYEEAFNQLSWPQELMNDVSARKQKTAPGKKILLSVAPLNLTRHEKADYYSKPDAITDSIKNYWKQLPLNDLKIVTAYFRYVCYLIDQLHPQEVNYGVESNSAEWTSTDFNLYTDFLSKVYGLLKQKYPDLPFFLSFMVMEEPVALAHASALMPYSDYIGLSSYPYTASSTLNGMTDPSKLPADFFTRYINLAPTKPWGFAETGYIAQDLNLPSYSLSRHGTTAWQRDYLEKIFTLCNEQHARFLVWFCSSDYDAGIIRIKQMGIYQELFSLWQDTGFTDENNAMRPSYHLWLQWMDRKVQ
jgi:hypothetical protein